MEKNAAVPRSTRQEITISLLTIMLETKQISICAKNLIIFPCPISPLRQVRNSSTSSTPRQPMSREHKTLRTDCPHISLQLSPCSLSSFPTPHPAVQGASISESLPPSWVTPESCSWLLLPHPSSPRCGQPLSGDPCLPCYSPPARLLRASTKLPEHISAPTWLSVPASEFLEGRACGPFISCLPLRRFW